MGAKNNYFTWPYPVSPTKGGFKVAYRCLPCFTPFKHVQKKKKLDRLGSAASCPKQAEDPSLGATWPSSEE